MSPRGRRGSGVVDVDLMRDVAHATASRLNRSARRTGSEHVYLVRRQRSVLSRLFRGIRRTHARDARYCVVQTRSSTSGGGRR